MKISKTMQLLCIILLILPFCVSGILVNSVSNDEQSGLFDVNYVRIEVYGFDEFHKVSNAVDITSDKLTNSLEFTYLGTPAQDACELYVFNDLHFVSHDFYATVNISFDYTGSYLGRFYLSTEGNCTEDGHTADNAEEMLIAENTVEDIWPLQEGRFRIRASIDDQYEESYTAYGSTGTFGDDYNFTISRKDGTLTSTIFKNGVIVKKETWVGGITKPLNSILLGGWIYTDMTTDFTVEFSDFYAWMDLDYSTTCPSGIEFFYILVSSFIGIPIIGLVFRKYKKV